MAAGGINGQSYRICLPLLMVMAMSTVSAQTSAGRADEELAKDLRTVIVLAGYQCKEITEHSQPNQSDYLVSCDLDRHYLVRISKETGLVVENQSDPSTTVSQQSTEHEEFMKRQLSAIVNLTGHDCAGVLSFERQGPRDSIVTCQDQSVFRIYVTREGRVAVDEHPVEK